MPKDDLIEGWQAIANVFGLSEKTMRNRKQELLDAEAICFMWRGSPPNRTFMVCAKPSKLWAWATKKAKKGETI